MRKAILGKCRFRRLIPPHEHHHTVVGPGADPHPERICLAYLDPCGVLAENRHAKRMPASAYTRLNGNPEDPALPCGKRLVLVFLHAHPAGIDKLLNRHLHVRHGRAKDIRDSNRGFRV